MAQRRHSTLISWQRKILIFAAVFCLLLSGSLAIFGVVVARDDERTLLLERSQWLEHALTRQAESYQSLLLSARSMITLLVQPTPAMWNSFAETLELSRLYPEVRSLFFVANVPEEELSSFEKRLRILHNMPDLTIPPAENEAVFPLAQVYPIGGYGEFTIGYDIGNKLALRIAALQAAVENRTVMTPIFHVNHNQATQTSVVFLPVWKVSPVSTPHVRERKLLGWIGIGLNVRGVVAKLSPFSKGLRIELNDLTPNDPHAPPRSFFDAHPNTTHEVIIPMLGRDVRLSFTTEGMPFNDVVLLVWAGSAVSLLLSAFLWLVLFRHFSLYNRMLALLRREATRLRAMHQQVRNRGLTTRQGYWCVDTNGKTIEADYRMCQMLGYEDMSLVGLSIYDLSAPHSHPTLHRQTFDRPLRPQRLYDLDLIRRNGDLLRAHIISQTRFDADGAVIGASLLVADWNDFVKGTTPSSANEDTMETPASESPTQS